MWSFEPAQAPACPPAATPPGVRCETQAERFHPPPVAASVGPIGPLHLPEHLVQHPLSHPKQTTATVAAGAGAGAGVGVGAGAAVVAVVAAEAAVKQGGEEDQ